LTHYITLEIEHSLEGCNLHARSLALRPMFARRTPARFSIIREVQ
jgi:hypothetical protein